MNILEIFTTYLKMFFSKRKEKTNIIVNYAKYKFTKHTCQSYFNKVYDGYFVNILKFVLQFLIGVYLTYTVNVCLIRALAIAWADLTE